MAMKHGIRAAVVVAAGALSTVGFAGIAHAAPGDNGNGVGGCIDDLYGNATNERPSGHGVLPSQSPGPSLNTGPNEPPRNDRLWGPTVGDLQTGLHDLLGPPAGNYTPRDFCPTT
jgi:hypothetical protein